VVAIYKALGGVGQPGVSQPGVSQPGVSKLAGGSG